MLSFICQLGAVARLHLNLLTFFVSFFPLSWAVSPSGAESVRKFYESGPLTAEEGYRLTSEQVDARPLTQTARNAVQIITRFSLWELERSERLKKEVWR